MKWLRDLFDFSPGFKITTARRGAGEPGSVSRGHLELSLRYSSTDPNFWTSYNGALVMIGWRL